MDKREAQEISNEVVSLLSQERKEKEISNYRLSKLTGLGEGTLSLIERNQSHPSFHVLVMIADAIGADLGAIIQKVMKD